MCLINQTQYYVLLKKWTLREKNKQQQRTEMHFTIIEAETCDKVKLLLFLITFYFPFFSYEELNCYFAENKNEWLVWGNISKLTHSFQLIKISWNGENKSWLQKDHGMYDQKTNEVFWFSRFVFFRVEIYFNCLRSENENIVAALR